MKLFLGVKDIAYQKKKKDSVTTGDVAEWLEKRYTIMEYFFETHKDYIAQIMAEDMALQIETLMAGAPPTQSMIPEAMDTLKLIFISFLEREEMNGIEGIPTRRAQLGKRKRYRNQSKKRPPRPSFMDTGNYSQSFHAWVEGYLIDYTG